MASTARACAAWRLVVASASLVLVSAAACGPDATSADASCGAGTSGGSQPCVPTTTEGPGGDGRIPDAVVDLRVATMDGVFGFGDTASVGMGIPTTFALVGSFPDGSGSVLVDGVSFVVDDDPDVTLTTGDGYATVLVRREGTFTLTASAATRGAPRLSSMQLRSVPPQHLRLDAATVPAEAGDAPLRRETLLSGVIPAAISLGATPGIASAGGRLQVVATLAYDLIVPASSSGGGNAGSGAAQHGVVSLPPEALRLLPSTGNVDGTGRWTANITGDATVGVSHHLDAPSGEVVEAVASGRFVTPSPVTGLTLAAGRLLPSLPLEARAVASYAPDMLTLSSFTDGTLMQPGHPASNSPALLELPASQAAAEHPASFLLAAVHGHGEEAYFEAVPWTDVTFDVLAGAPSVAALPTGAMAGSIPAGAPGVAAFVASAAGFELPGLLLVPYPATKAGSSATLRVAPSPLTITMPAPGAPDVCASVQLFVSPPGGQERPASDLEALVADRFVEAGDGGPDRAKGARATDFCISAAGDNPGTSTFQFRLLGAFTRLDVTVAAP